MCKKFYKVQRMLKKRIKSKTTKNYISIPKKPLQLFFHNSCNGAKKVSLHLNHLRIYRLQSFIDIFHALISRFCWRQLGGILFIIEPSFVSDLFQ